MYGCMFVDLMYTDVQFALIYEAHQKTTNSFFLCEVLCFASFLIKTFHHDCFPFEGRGFVLTATLRCHFRIPAERFQVFPPELVGNKTGEFYDLCHR